MARLSVPVRESSDPPSSASDSSDSCIILAPSLTTGSTKSSDSTRPTSIASISSVEEPVAKKKFLGQKKRSSTTAPPAAGRLESFGFTAMARPSKTETGPITKVPRAKVPRTSSARTHMSWLEEASDDEIQARHASTNSQTPLVAERVEFSAVRNGILNSKDAIKVESARPGRINKSYNQTTVRKSQDAETIRLLREVSPEATDVAKGLTTKDCLYAEATQDQKNLLKDDSLETKTDPGQTLEDSKESAEPTKPSRIEKMMGAVSATASSLGKRSRDAFEKGKDRFQHSDRRKSTRVLQIEAQQEDQTKEPVLKKVKRSNVNTSKPSSSSKTTACPSKKTSKSKKSWLEYGMYVGQDRSFKPNLSGAKRKRNSEVIGTAVPMENKSLPLPMFFGEDLLKHGRDFKLPFDVFAPLPPGQPKPDEWRKTTSNRTIGDAAQAVSEWRKFNKLPASRCYCSLPGGCDENCLNRSMFYECDDNNCAIGGNQCTNRGFAELKERCKRGNKYDIGVEVLKTDGKGFGVRACRTFNPGQIIVEYAGEMINREECERRMREEYKDNTCYYLMTFDRNLIIDATRGTIARFVNHSCAPNCAMVKWTVAGKPRMALFAGDRGITTGEELTYDYNFDNFNKNNLTLCRCGASTCRGVLGPKPTEQELKKARLAAAAAEMAERAKEMVAQLAGRNGDGKKRKKHKGWQYIDADGNEVSEPEDGVEQPDSKQRPAKKQKTAETKVAKNDVSLHKIGKSKIRNGFPDKKHRTSSSLLVAAATTSVNSTGGGGNTQKVTKSTALIQASTTERQVGKAHAVADSDEVEDEDENEHDHPGPSVRKSPRKKSRLIERLRA